MSRLKRVIHLMGFVKAFNFRETNKITQHYNEDFLRLAKKSPADIANEDIKNCLFYLADEKDSSASTLNIAINALKFYYGEMLKRNFVFEIKGVTYGKS